MYHFALPLEITNCTWRIADLSIKSLDQIVTRSWWKLYGNWIWDRTRMQDCWLCQIHSILAAWWLLVPSADSCKSIRWESPLISGWQQSLQSAAINPVCWTTSWLLFWSLEHDFMKLFHHVKIACYGPKRFSSKANIALQFCSGRRGRTRKWVRTVFQSWITTCSFW